MADATPQETSLVVEDESNEITADGYSYKIDLYTGDVWGAGTDANVLLTLYGEDGDSGQRCLNNSGNDFERDSTDHFKIVNPSHFGRIKKIVIGHDNSGISPSWFLDKVTAEDVKTREVFDFPCKRWLSKDEDDGLISRELVWTHVTVKEKEERESYPYTINIYTGNEWGAGTDANVHIAVYGTKSRSRKYKLKNKGHNTFESGMKDTCKFETKNPLGTIYKVRVGHDNTGFGPGWLLDKIEIEDDITGEIVKFACGKWFSTDSEDGLISRDLLREGFSEEEVDAPLESVTYTVNIFTGHPWGAGTDANVFLTLYGTDGESKQLKIENKGSTTFENGMTDTVKFDSSYLGTLTKIRIGHDNTGWGPAWFLDKVTVEDPKKGETVEFLCHRWLATNADDGMIERELFRKDSLQIEKKKEQEEKESQQREKEIKQRQEKERQEQEEKDRKYQEEQERQLKEKERKERQLMEEWIMFEQEETAMAGNISIKPEETKRQEGQVMEEMIWFEQENTVMAENQRKTMDYTWKESEENKGKERPVIEETIMVEEGSAVMAGLFPEDVEDLDKNWQELQKEEKKKRLDKEKEELEKERQEKIEKERQEKLEKEKQEKLEKERQEKLEKERQEKLEKERQEKLEKERQEKLEKETQEKLEKERQEKLEKERQEKLEKERQEKLEKETQEKLEKETQEKERQEKLEKETQEKLEKERQEKLEKERQEKLEKERQEKLEKETQEKLEKETQEKLEKERHEKLEKERQEKLEKERQEKPEKERQEKLEKERQEKLEKERQEKLEKERQEKLEKERQEKLEKERQEKLEKERQEKLEKERQEKLEKERQEKLEKERQQKLEKERQQKLEKKRQEKLEKEKQEKLEKEKQEKLEKEEQEKLEKEKQEKLEKEKQEKLQKEKQEKLQKERQQKLEKERQQKLEKERQEKLEKERQQKLEKERQEKLEKERQEKLEKERQEKLEKERQEKQEKKRQRKLEKERQEKLEKERQEKLEKERQEKQEKERQRKLEKERQEKLEKERQEKLEKERQEKLEKVRQEKLEKEKREKLEKDRQEKLEKQKQEMLEKERKERDDKKKRVEEVAVTASLSGKPLGMESGKIKDESITASSSTKDTHPTWARLNYPGSWSAGKSDGSWLQVDLKTLHFVTSVATQGNPLGNLDYVRKFKLQYSEDGKNWSNHEENGNQVFVANNDNLTVKSNNFQKAIVARYIRICPLEWYVWPCMRVELYGAPFTKVQ